MTFSSKNQRRTWTCRLRYKIRWLDECAGS